MPLITYDMELDKPKYDGDPVASSVKDLYQIMNMGTLDNQNVSVAGLTLPGMIVAYGSSTIPAGWLLCDGTSYLRTTYPALFAAIGTAYGAADSTHFNIPDIRGRFIRGVSNAQTIDPDRAARTAMATGGNTGDAVGSVQTDTYGSHNHGGATGGQSQDHVHYFSTGGVTVAGGSTYNRPVNFNGSDYTYTSSGASQNHTHSVASGGGNETRPENIYCEYIIKY